MSVEYRKKLPKELSVRLKEYQLYLPSKELLRQKLLDWIRAQENRA